MTDIPPDHYNQAPRRKAEFIMPPNTLKAKVGTGGLSDDVIKKAQSLIENNQYDFKPQGEEVLEKMLMAMTEARRANGKDTEKHIVAVMFQAMILKTNGGMFHYDLVTKIADRLVQFLEVIDEIQDPEVQIIEAFYTTLRAVFVSEIRGVGNANGQQLYAALMEACNRYFEKYQHKPNMI